MSLGENIYKLRTENNMSQMDLAEKLEVSRQSVSKWETDASVPDLDKLLKLSSLFNVTLDELVNGDKREPPPALEVGPTPRETGRGRKVAGLILLCAGFIVFLVLGAVSGDFLSAFVLSLPFLACAAVCFLFRRNTSLWCIWTIYLLVTVYLNYSSSIQWSLVFNPYFYQNAHLHLHLTIAYFLFLILITLINVSAFRLGRQLSPPSSLIRPLLGIGGFTAATFLSSWLSAKVFWWFRESLGQEVDGVWIINEFAYTGIYSALEFIRIACSTAALVLIVLVFRSRRAGQT